MPKIKTDAKDKPAKPGDTKNDSTGSNKASTFDEFIRVFNFLLLEDKYLPPMVNEYALPTHKYLDNIKDFRAAVARLLKNYIFNFDPGPSPLLQGIVRLLQLLESPAEDISKLKREADAFYHKSLVPIFKREISFNFTKEELSEFPPEVYSHYKNLFSPFLPDSFDRPEPKIKPFKLEILELNSPGLLLITAILLGASMLLTFINMMSKVESKDPSVWKDAYEFGLLEGKLSQTDLLSDTELKKMLRSGVSSQDRARGWNQVRELKKVAITRAEEKWKNGSQSYHTDMAEKVYDEIKAQYPIECEKYKKQFTVNSLRRTLKPIASSFDRLLGNPKKKDTFV